MPKFELELDDKGEFIGDLPTELKSVHDRLRAAAYGEGFGKGNEKAAAEAKTQIEHRIAEERRRLEASMPLEKAKWDEIDTQNKTLKIQLDSTAVEARKAMTAREEAHATEITRRMKDLEVRDRQIDKLMRATLRGLAAQVGARDESLSELEVILAHRVGYRDDMEPFVKSEDGTGEQKTAAGNPMSLEVFVRQYLDNHPHHRKAPAGRGGARPGASLVGPGEPSAETRDIQQHIASTGDRSAGTIDRLFKATRRKSA